MNSPPPELPQLCVIVPCFNEQESLPVLIRTLTPVLEEATGGSWRVLLIDDGSGDDTARLIWECHARDPRILGLRLSRNFGHQAAVATALKFADGRAIGIIDCDLQDPPAALIQLFDKIRHEGFDVCAGQRGEREDVPVWLRGCYACFYRLMAAMAEHPFTLDAGDFCVFNRRVLHALQALPEVMQVQRGLRSWVGFRQTTVEYRRPTRLHGRSKYDLGRLIRLAIDNVVNFTTFPLRMAAWLGLGMIGLIGLAAVFFLVNRFVPSFAPFGYRIGDNVGTTTLVLYFSVVAAVILLSLGILGEYLAVLIREVKRRPFALVAEATPGMRGAPPGFEGVGPFLADDPPGPWKDAPCSVAPSSSNDQV